MHPLPLQDLWVMSADGMKTAMGSDDLIREHLEHLGINRVVICGDNVPWTATKVPTLRCSGGDLGNRTCLRSGSRVPRSRNSHCLTTTVVVCGLPPRIRISRVVAELFLEPTKATSISPASVGPLALQRVASWGASYSCFGCVVCVVQNWRLDQV